MVKGRLSNYTIKWEFSLLLVSSLFAMICVFGMSIFRITGWEMIPHFG